MTLQKEHASSVAAVIPALNEAAAIANVVRAVSPYAKPIVVDDGSSDGTAELAREAGAVVVVHEQNQGYDRALESGLFKALELGFDYAITLDGDGQHAPATIDLFKAELAKGADLVVGARDKHQRFAESLFAWVGKLLWNVQDPLCGMKGYRLDRLALAGRFDTYSSVGTEFTIRAVRSGYRITEIPIMTRERIGTSRFGTGMRANWRILQALFRGLLKAKAFKKAIHP